MSQRQFWYRGLTALCIVAALRLSFPSFVTAEDEPNKASGNTISLTGKWEGHIYYGNRLGDAIRVEFSGQRDQNAKDQIYVPKWGEEPIALLNLRRDADQLSFEFRDSMERAGRFQGRIMNDEIRGEYTWDKTKYTFAISKHALPEESFRSQRRFQVPPAHPKYTSTRIKFRQGRIELSGILTVPPGPGPHPAVVFLNGSGGNASDAQVPGRPGAMIWHWVIADLLTQTGCATLRLDSRGFGESSGTYTDASLADLADDAIAAVSEIRNLKGVDPKRIGLAGLSEGGIVATIATARSKNVNALLLLSTPGLPLDKVFLNRYVTQARQAELSEDLIEHRLKIEREFFALMKGSQAAEDVRAEIITRFADASKTSGFTAREVLDKWLLTNSTPLHRSEIRYDPTADLHKIAVPVLAVYGEKDVWVDAVANSAHVRSALGEGSNLDVKVLVLPHLNHQLQESDDGWLQQNEYTIDPKAVDVLRIWITSHFHLADAKTTEFQPKSWKK